MFAFPDWDGSKAFKELVVEVCPVPPIATGRGEDISNPFFILKSLLAISILYQLDYRRAAISSAVKPSATNFSCAVSLAAAFAAIAASLA